MDERLNAIKNEIDKYFDNPKIKKLKKERERLENLRDTEKAKELLGKHFIYKNNSYSVPSAPSDYWNVYYKIIGIEKDDLIVLFFEKTSHGNIKIEKEKESIRYFGNMLSEISKEVFEKEFNKILEELGLK